MDQQHETTRIPELGANDILIGRGFQYEGHPGNVFFYETIDSFMVEYFDASTKGEKTSIISKVHDHLTESGRFVKYDSSSKTYMLVDEKEARQKISHALRYRRQTLGTTALPTELAPAPVMTSSSPEVNTPSNEAAHATAPLTAKRSSPHHQQAHDPVGDEQSSPKRLKFMNDSSSTSGLFSEYQLEGALGKPGEMDLTMLHSLEDLSTFEGVDDSPPTYPDIETKQPALKSSPVIPDAVEVKGEESGLGLTLQTDLQQEKEAAPSSSEAHPFPSAMGHDEVATSYAGFLSMLQDHSLLQRPGNQFDALENVDEHEGGDPNLAGVHRQVGSLPTLQGQASENENEEEKRGTSLPN